MRSWRRTFSQVGVGTSLILYFTSTSFLLLAMSACSTLGTELTEVAEGNGQFAFELFKAVRSASPGGNLIISPLSITTCLALCYAGSKEKTADQIRDVMKLPKDDNTVHKAFKSIMRSFSNKKEIDALTINIANRIYVQQDFPLMTEYLSALHDFFEADIGKANFAKEPETGRVLINKWVQEVTKDKIKDLLPEGSVDALTRAVLVSAIYFKGDWKTKFDAKLTREDDFKLDKTRTVKLPMMFLKSKFRISWDRKLKYKLLELPYVGSRFSMLVLLPDDHEGLSSIEDTLSIADLKTSIGGLQQTEVKVTLPKFKVAHTTQLNEALQSMGITDLFSTHANLSGMTGDNSLFVGTAVHKAFLEVNEEGSEAAAATGMVMQMRAMVMEPEFRADHPFLVFIYDKLTGLILFMGRITDPK